MFGKKKTDSGDPKLIEAMRAALATVEDPDFGRDIVDLGYVSGLSCDGSSASMSLRLTTPLDPQAESLRAQCEGAMTSVDGIDSAEVTIEHDVPAAQALLQKQSVGGVKNIIAVSSGKGGVGKSTVAVNLAMALAKAGAAVGILDADVYGPNVPLMLGLSGRPEGREGKIVPFECDGMRVMSMAFLVKEEQPVVWRGPMLHSAVKQFLYDVEWGELDYLIVDLPPGTGDAQLSLAQQSHLMGAVIVTTPQDVSVLDVKKAIAMFGQVNVPVLGVVENMAGMALRGRVEGGASKVSIEGPSGEIQADVAGDGSFALELDVFGSGGGDAIAERFEIPLLGRVPLDPAVRVGGDSGKPVTRDEPNRLVAQRFREVAGRMSKSVAVRNLDNPASLSV